MDPILVSNDTHIFTIAPLSLLKYQWYRVRISTYNRGWPSARTTERGKGRNDLVVVQHVVEGLSQFVRDLLDLQLLAVDLVLDVVNPLVQLGDVHLAVLVPDDGDDGDDDGDSDGDVHLLILVPRRSPCCVLLALSWNTTNENPSTDKLSRAINYQ